MSGVQFEEPIRTTSEGSKSNSSFVSFLLKQGLVKDEGQGQTLLIIIALLAFAAAGYFFMESMPKVAPPEPIPDSARAIHTFHA